LGKKHVFESCGLIFAGDIKYILKEYCYKLCPYDTPPPSTTHEQDRPAAKPSQKSAADILGLNCARISPQQGISIEMEVDQYLSNPNQGTGVLEFWQVMFHF